MPDIYAIPSKPWMKPHRVTSLSDVTHEAQREAAAAALGLVYTPHRLRGTECAAEKALSALSRLKDGMLGKDHDILLAAINAGYWFIRMDDGWPIITIDHSLKKEDDQLFLQL